MMVAVVCFNKSGVFSCAHFLAGAVVVVVVFVFIRVEAWRCATKQRLKDGIRSCVQEVVEEECDADTGSVDSGACDLQGVRLQQWCIVYEQHVFCVCLFMWARCVGVTFGHQSVSLHMVLREVGVGLAGGWRTIGVGLA